MSWKKLPLPAGSKLFSVNNFTFIHKTSNYVIEINEYQDGSFVGYGEHSTDKNFFIQPVSGKTADDCIKELIQKIIARDP